MHNDMVKPGEHEAEVFWGEISPCEHLVPIYQDDGVFLDSLEGFIAGGLLSGDGVVVIATPPHLSLLETRLAARGIDVAGAAQQDQYLALDAEDALAKFMVNGWPDETLFRTFVTEILKRAKGRDRRVRAFGEMVACCGPRAAPVQPCSSNISGTGCVMN